jgi:hypothetical protein
LKYLHLVCTITEPAQHTLHSVFNMREEDFNRADQPRRSQAARPWQSWYHKIVDEVKNSTPDQREAKPWLKGRSGDYAKGEVIVQKPFYTWLADPANGQQFLCNQGED